MSDSKITLNCEICGTEFIGYHKTRYCPQCRFKIRSERMRQKYEAGEVKPPHREIYGEGVCLRCGKKFDKTSHNKKYCSDRCRMDMYRQFQGPPDEMDIAKFIDVGIKDPESLQDITCPVCGKVFKQKAPRQAYCSDTCRDFAHLGSRRKTNENGDVICAICGKAFHTDHPGKRYCSIECYKKGKAERDRARHRANKRTGRAENSDRARPRVDIEEEYTGEEIKQIHKKSTVVQMAAEAKERHMSYGYLSALKAGLI